MQKLIYIAAVRVDVISNPSRYRLASRKMEGA
jgi:hypothetical protein